MKNGLLLKVIGLLWTIGASLLLATEILGQLKSEFWLGWGYYILVWGFFIFCLVSGVFAFLGWRTSRGLLSSAAVVLALYCLFVLVAYWPENKTIFIALNLLLVAFSVSTLLVIWKMPPNNRLVRTPETTRHVS